MDTYYNRLNAFFKENAKSPLNPEDQLVMLHLLHHNNQVNNVGGFYLTDGQLMARTRLTQKQVTAAKRNLKNKGFIDFKTNPASPRSGTLYTLPSLQNATKPKSPKPKAEGDFLSVNSEEVRHAWRVSAGENLTGNKALVMIQLENSYGTKVVVDAIGKAELSNTAPRLTVNYVKAILENKRGENKRVGTCKKPATNAPVQPVERDDDIDTNLPEKYR